MSDRFEFVPNFDPLLGGPQIRPGQFLVASEALRRTPFQQTVLLMLQNNQEGSVGVVLNRPVDAAVASFWRDTTGMSTSDRKVCDGGPLGGPVLALHQHKSLAEIEISDGVCLSVNSQSMLDLMNIEDTNYRIILGLAGWEPKQLVGELKRGLWYVVAADPKHAFDDHWEMWRNFTRAYIGQSLAEAFGDKILAQNPGLN